MAFVALAAATKKPEPRKYASPLHVPERNCSVGFEKDSSEICVPRLMTTCREEEVELKEAREEEQCISIPMISCSAAVREIGLQKSSAC